MRFVDETGKINTRQFHNDYCLPRDYMPSPEEWHLNPNNNASIRLLRPLLQTMTYPLRMGLSHMFFNWTRNCYGSIILELLCYS